MITTQTKWERAKNLRYKRSALSSMGWEFMMDEIYGIEEACSDVRWFFEDDGDNLVAAMDGDDDEAYEFKMAFSELEAKCEQLAEAIRENRSEMGSYFDDCTVALIGNRYRLVGFDSAEEDYFHLTDYDSKIAETEAGKRVCRWTKAEMLSKIGQCMGVLLAYYDLRQSYDYLKATMDILRDQNMSVLKTVKRIEELYEKTQTDDFYGESGREFEKLLECLPDRVWIE